MMQKHSAYIVRYTDQKGKKLGVRLDLAPKETVCEIQGKCLNFFACYLPQPIIHR